MPRGSFTSSYNTPLTPGALERGGQRPGIRASAKREQLHEQAVVGSLRLAVLHPAFLAEIGRLRSAAGTFGVSVGFDIRRV